MLDSKVISSKTSIINLQDDADIVYRTRKDLGSQLLDGFEIMLPVLDLKPPLLQMFSDFALQPPVIGLQASHSIQVGGQVVIQSCMVSFSLWMLLILARPATVHPARPPDPQLLKLDTEI
jgi:hypothetical protein